MESAVSKAEAEEDLFLITVTAGNDNEPKRIFVSVNDRPFQIERGKQVAVPKEVLHALDLAIVGVPEIDEAKNEINWTERQRFPYTVHGTVKRPRKAVPA